MKHVKRFDSFLNEEKKHYVQSALVLKPEEKTDLLKIVTDAEFEIDDTDEEIRQLIWSDKFDEKQIRDAIAKVTGHP